MRPKEGPSVELARAEDLVERRHGSNGVRGLGVGIDPLSDDGIVPVNARDHVHGDTSTEHGGDAGVPEVV